MASEVQVLLKADTGDEERTEEKVADCEEADDIVAEDKETDDKEEVVLTLDQEERRKAIIEELKDWQFDYTNHAYKVTRDHWGKGKEKIAPVATDNVFLPGNHYTNQLMLSEWLMEIPDDWEAEWLMVPCPWGKRCLVIAGQGGTVTYDSDGLLICDFPSLLPGGNRKHLSRYEKDNVILDCLYHEIEKVYYVLDMMCWCDQAVYDNEAELRFFLMKSRLEEIPDLKETSSINPYKFVVLENYACSNEGMKTALESVTMKVDGCLFYHKKVRYLFGVTPMSLWLKPFMMKEVLEVEVPEAMMEKKPANYTTYQNYLQHILQMEKRRTERWQSTHKKRDDDRPKRPRGPDRAKDFKIDLMMSEWLLEVPENLEEDWLVVVCPVGKRCLVIAIDGETKCFTKTGFRIPGYFVSLLPGGNMKFSKDSMTLLDCIYYEELETYFILDIISWDKNDVTNLDTEARFLKIRQEVSRTPNLKMFHPAYNHHKFSVLKNYECTTEGITRAIRSTRFEIDGLLFFNKTATYVSGSTPNVLWTKPYMLPEVLNVPVSDYFMEEKPPAYLTFQQFVQDTKDGKTIERKKKKKKKQSKEFVPQHELNLPLPAAFNMAQPGSKKKAKKEKKKEQSKDGQQGAGFIVYRFGRQGQFLARGQGQRNDGQGRPLRSAGSGRGLGRYFNGAGDRYQQLPDMRYGPGMNYGRNQNYDPFGMTDMLSALEYANYDSNYRPRKKYY